MDFLAGGVLGWIAAIIMIWAAYRILEKLGYRIELKRTIKGGRGR